MRTLSALLTVAALLMAGCRQATTITEVRPDGGASRRVVLGVSGGMGAVTPEALSQAFRVPRGEGITTSEPRAAALGGLELEVKQELRPGQTLRDDVVLLWKGQALTSNRVEIREVEPGVLEYRETLSWVPKARAQAEGIQPAARAALREAFPKDFSPADAQWEAFEAE